MVNKLVVTSTYDYFDVRGSCSFPSAVDVRSAAASGAVVVLVPDANVCLHLSNYGRGRLDATQGLAVRQFLLAIEFVRADVAPYFGCLELASNKDGTVDNEKLSSFATNIKAALDQSENVLARGYRVLGHDAAAQRVENESVAPIYPMLRTLYACFLEIQVIRSRGSLKSRALANLVEFYDWCERMECQIGLIGQAAFALFGGSEQAAKLLTHPAKKTPQDAAWRAAWDVWYAWMIQNYLPTVLLDGVAQRPIFVTNDPAAAFTAGQCRPRVFMEKRGERCLSISSVNYDFPYFEGRQAEVETELAKRRQTSLMRVVDRVAAGGKHNPEKMEEEIRRLDSLIGRNFGAKRQ